MTVMTLDEVFVDLPPAAVDALRRNITSLGCAAQHLNVPWVADGVAAPVPADDLEILADAGLVRLTRSGDGTPLNYRVTADGYARISLYLEATS